MSYNKRNFQDFNVLSGSKMKEMMIKYLFMPVLFCDCSRYRFYFALLLFKRCVDILYQDNKVTNEQINISIKILPAV